MPRSRKMTESHRIVPRSNEHGAGGYDSEFSDDENEAEISNCKSQRTRNDATILKKPFQKEKYTRLPHKQVAAQEGDREEARNRRFHLIAMDAYARHKKYINDYLLYYGGSKEDLKRSTVNDKTDLDVIRDNHRFLWTEGDETDMNWEKALAKKYYDKLFKEYCIADLSQYKHNKIGFRWRVDKEVISGKGVCTECSYKLNYHHKRKEAKSAKRKGKEEHHDAPAEKITKTREKQSSKSKGKSSASRTDSDDDDSDKESEDTPNTEDPSEAEYWKGPCQDVEDKTREDEFDEYFEDMFL
ncbi:protein FRA10AC1 isoform X3 [Mobula hypostoma]|uniref:protein FRA10AC1 isoform X3 n=1 Tax=Mobula hypostoma TaxID=723540 RepID=UPI002FC3DC10